MELTYSLMQRSRTNKSADFFAKQQARLKERIARWPGDLPKLVHLLDHKYSQASLFQSTLKARDRAVVEILSSACSQAGIYLFFGNITKQEYDGGDYDEIEICLDSICTAEGERIAWASRCLSSTSWQPTLTATDQLTVKRMKATAVIVRASSYTMIP